MVEYFLYEDGDDTEWRIRVGLVHLDDCYHHDPGLAASVPAFDGTGRIVNFSDPASIDPARVDSMITRHAGAEVIVVEGIFAPCPGARQGPGALERLRGRARRHPDRKINEGRDPRDVLRGYLEQGRRAHERHVALTRLHADLVKQLRLLIRA